jgi:YbbR domain-containing protein
MNSRGLFNRVSANWPVKILALVAAIILHLSYRIGSLEERFFSVPLRIETNNSFVPVGDVPRSVRISVRGQADEIFLVLEDDIEAFVNLRDFRSEGQFRVSVQIRKTGTAENTEFEMNVEPLEATITIEERIVKTVEIYPEIRGVPAEGFELAEYTIKPSAIEVKGPRSAIEQLSSARTDEIDLTGRAEGFAVRLRVFIDAPRAEIVGSDIVEFSGSIRPIVVAKRIDGVKVVPVGVAEGVEVELRPEAGSVRVRGSTLEVDDVGASDFRIAVDCTGLSEPGVYEGAVSIEHTTNVEVISSQPPEVTIEVFSVSGETE